MGTTRMTLCNLLVAAFVLGVTVADVPELKTDVEVQFDRTGLMDTVIIRCGMDQIPGLSIDTIETLGQFGPDGTMATVESSGISTFDETIHPKKLSIKGTVDCKNAYDKGCVRGEAAYSNLKYRGYPYSFQDPLYQTMGCRITGQYNGQGFEREVKNQYLMREEMENGPVDGTRIFENDIYYKLRGGLLNGSVRYFYMKCSVNMGTGLDIKSIEIKRPNGTLVRGIYSDGRAPVQNANNLRAQESISCPGKGCESNEAGFMTLTWWINDDFNSEIGTSEVHDQYYYYLTCEVNMEAARSKAKYTELRDVRVKADILPADQ